MFVHGQDKREPTSLKYYGMGGGIGTACTNVYERGLVKGVTSIIPQQHYMENV